MNEQAIQLIEKLALKLGITAEYLWGVLIKQAPISGFIGITGDVILLFLLYWMWKKLLSVDFSNWDNDFGKGSLYGGLAITTMLCLGFVFGDLPTEISGIVNPEYWALKQIIPGK